MTSPIVSSGGSCSGDRDGGDVVAIIIYAGWGRSPSAVAVVVIPRPAPATGSASLMYTPVGVPGVGFSHCRRAHTLDSSSPAMGSLVRLSGEGAYESSSGSLPLDLPSRETQKRRNSVFHRPVTCCRDIFQLRLLLLLRQACRVNRLLSWSCETGDMYFALSRDQITNKSGSSGRSSQLEM